MQWFSCCTVEHCSGAASKEVLPPEPPIPQQRPRSRKPTREEAKAALAAELTIESVAEHGAPSSPSREKEKPQTRGGSSSSFSEASQPSGQGGAASIQAAAGLPTNVEQKEVRESTVTINVGAGAERLPKREQACQRSLSNERQLRQERRIASSEAVARFMSDPSANQAATREAVEAALMVQDTSKEYERGLSHSRSLLSDGCSRAPSTLLVSRSTASLGSSLSGSFLSRSTCHGSQSVPPLPRPSITTRTISVQTEEPLDIICSRCTRPPRPPPSRAQVLPSAAGGGFPRLQRMGTSLRRRRRVSLNSSKCALHQFGETPRASQMMCVLFALEHMNPRGEGCCGYHIGCANLALILQEMCASECMPEFYPMTGWQCAHCLSLNGMAECGADADSGEEAFLECEVCGGSTRARAPPPPRAVEVYADGADAGESSQPTTFRSGEDSIASSCSARVHAPVPQLARPPLDLIEEAATNQVQSSVGRLPKGITGSAHMSGSTELPMGSAVQTEASSTPRTCSSASSE